MSERKSKNDLPDRTVNELIDQTERSNKHWPMDILSEHFTNTFRCNLNETRNNGVERFFFCVVCFSVDSRISHGETRSICKPVTHRSAAAAATLDALCLDRCLNSYCEQRRRPYHRSRSSVVAAFRDERDS